MPCLFYRGCHAHALQRGHVKYEMIMSLPGSPAALRFLQAVLPERQGFTSGLTGK
ncbi:MAG: hypothetical protein WD045_16205 [Pirellulaceae bacterium]